MSEELELFSAEAYDLLDKMEEELLVLEKSPTSIELVGKVFGFLHNIKANSLYLHLEKYVHICQIAEEFLEKSNKANSVPSSAEFDLLFNFVDVSRSYVDALSSGDAPIGPLDEWLSRAEGLKLNS